MKGEVEALPLREGPGLGVVAPGGEIGAGSREVLPKQGCNGGHGLGPLQRSDLIGGIHAVVAAAELQNVET
jgi:hypothetical protein